MNRIYERLLKARPEISNWKKGNNVTLTYRNKLIKIFKKFVRRSRSEEEVSKLRLQFDEANKAVSIEGVKELLGIEQLRRHVKRHYIQKKRLMIDILKEDSSCHTKKFLLDAYPQFVAAVDDPSSLTKWF